MVESGGAWLQVLGALGGGGVPWWPRWQMPYIWDIRIVSRRAWKEAIPGSAMCDENRLALLAGTGRSSLSPIMCGVGKPNSRSEGGKATVMMKKDQRNRNLTAFTKVGSMRSNHQEPHGNSRQRVRV